MQNKLRAQSHPIFEILISKQADLQRFTFVDMLNNVFEHNETHISKNGEKAQLLEAFYSGFEFICCHFVVLLCCVHITA